jgi:DNA uptake protein ComE-like DNA-binding protein
LSRKIESSGEIIMAATRNEGAWGDANREESSQGKININTASKEELEKVQGIGTKRAEMIVQ